MMRAVLVASGTVVGLVSVLSYAPGDAPVAVLGEPSAGSAPEMFGRFGTAPPTTGTLVEAGLWLALVGAVSFGLAFGVSSFVGSSGSSIAILLGLWLVVTPLVETFDPGGWLFDVWRPGAPFIVMGLANALVLCLAIGVRLRNPPVPQRAIPA